MADLSPLPRSRLARNAYTFGVGLFLFLTSAALTPFRANGRVLWSRLIIPALTRLGLAWSARHSVQQVLAVAAAGLMVVVLVEQSTLRTDDSSHETDRRRAVRTR